AQSRPTTSVAPPGENGTISLIGRSGKAASAGRGKVMAASVAIVVLRKSRRFITYPRWGLRVPFSICHQSGSENNRDKTEQALTAKRAPGPEIDRNLPIGGEIFLDHVGHFVRDADTASRALARAGFAPTPKSVQFNPDGTPTG